MSYRNAKPSRKPEEVDHRATLIFCFAFAVLRSALMDTSLWTPAAWGLAAFLALQTCLLFPSRWRRLGVWKWLWFSASTSCAMAGFAHLLMHFGWA